MPKRRSLMDMIDADHPMSRSSVAEAQRSGRASDARAQRSVGDRDSEAIDSLPFIDPITFEETSSSSEPASPKELAPGPPTLSLAQINMLRVQEQAEAAPRRGPSCVWSQPLLVPPEDVVPPGAERRRRHRVRKPRAKKTMQAPNLSFDKPYNVDELIYSDPEENDEYLTEGEVGHAYAPAAIFQPFLSLPLDAYLPSSPDAQCSSSAAPCPEPLMTSHFVHSQQLAQQQALAMEQMVMQQQQRILIMQQQPPHIFGLAQMPTQVLGHHMPSPPLQPFVVGNAWLPPPTTPAYPMPAMHGSFALPPAAAVGHGAAAPTSNIVTVAVSNLSANRIPWGQLFDVATDAKGSRVLQDALSRLSKSHLCRACEELTPRLLQLAQHPFGNYVASTLAALEQMQPLMVEAFGGHVRQLLCNTQGSRVVQALLSSLPAIDAHTLVAELNGHVLEIALDTHGSWGVSVAFERTCAPFILDEVSQHVVALATQQNGCRVVQAVLKTAGNNGMDLSKAVTKMIEGELGHLAAHSFANYAVQVLLRHSTPMQRELLIRKLLPQVLVLSTSKHGSNVAESVLSLAPQRMLEKVCDEIFGSPPAVSLDGKHSGDALRSLMEHQFGNYVLQTLVRRLANANRRSFAIDKIKASTTSTNFGRSILARLGAE